MRQYRLVEDNFSPVGKELRAEFDARFADPKAARADRFVWDFWHVPDQYTHLRTPAEHFFSRGAYARFLRALGAWGRSRLGCAAITPPWLSYYVEGCEQRLHSDVPHGPWAFVYSLTPPRRAFRGGETMILRPAVLDYWTGFTEAQSRELGSFVDRVAPRFNRLVVFDPRLPHGVSRVSGTLDPREARLVVHGWFSEPRPCLEGALSARQAAPALDEAVGGLVEAMAVLGAWHGTLSLRLTVGPGGAVTGFAVLADSLVPLGGEPEAGARVRRLVRETFLRLRFPRARGKTRITLPLLFR